MSNRSIVAEDILDTIRALHDDEALCRSRLADSPLVTAHQAQECTESPAAAVRSRLRACWKAYSHELDQRAAKLETLDTSTGAAINGLMLTGIRDGLAPGYQPLSRLSYAAWLMQPGAIAQILRSVLPLTAQTQGQAIIDQWGERLRIGNLHQTRRHLLETAQNTLRHYPNVPGLRDFYNTLLDPCLDQRAWSDAISRLQQTLTDGHSRGEIWAEFAYHLLDPENLHQRTIPEAISELEALRTYPDGFYEIPPASRVSESRRSISRQLARIGNEKVAQLRQTRETQERNRLSLPGTGDGIIGQVQAPPRAHSESRTSAFRALKAVLHRYWSEAKWATLVFFALTGIMLYLAYGPVDHLVASLPLKLLERIADLLFTATLSSSILATGMVLQETRRPRLRQA